MNQSAYQQMVKKVRGIMPLAWRQRIGPSIAYISYLFNKFCRPNRWTPNVLTLSETIDAIIQKKLSIIRFGDGEMTLIEGEDLGFQNNSDALSVRLKEILKTKAEGLLICIPGLWSDLNKFTKISFWFTMHHLFRYEHVWFDLLSRNQEYGDALITRPYLGYKDKNQSKDLFNRLKEIWEGKDIVLIEGEKSRLGVGNDIFSNAKSLKRILCPAENAYARYDEILSEAKKISKDELILVSLGPTAKILAYDLFLLGYRVIDIGHIDMEYEMFLRNENRIIPVEGKYFNEIEERNPADCRDRDYLSQIIAKI